MDRVWGGVLANALAAAAPPLMQQGPAKVLCDIAADGRNVRTQRGAVYYAYAAFFLLEGVGILLFPRETLKAGLPLCLVSLNAPGFWVQASKWLDRGVCSNATAPSVGSQ